MAADSGSGSRKPRAGAGVRKARRISPRAPARACAAGQPAQKVHSGSPRRSATRAANRGGRSVRPLARAKSPSTGASRKLEPRLRPIRLLLLDVDGVLTDGGLYYTDSGEEMKRFHIHDGMGVDLLQRAGIQVGILTGRKSSLVERRARELGIRIVKQGFYDKSAGLAEVLREENLAPGEVGYVGDDVQDLAVMKEVGFRAAPSNATAEVRARADYVCTRSGGGGAVREVADLILGLLGRKEAAVAEVSSPGVKPPAGRKVTATV